MDIIVTGCAGFIGLHVATALLARGYHVIGIDDLNAYYDVGLKKSRLSLLEINQNFTFYRGSIAEREFIRDVFAKHAQVSYVMHLAAQPGVRHSLKDPYSYVTANVMGHLVMLEACRQLKNFKHFLYASSSSVYGANTQLPFATTNRVDHPISLYAASKRAGELISSCYNHLFNLPQTGFRFFTVYGPWGRPDMAPYIFTKEISAGRTIPIFNHGRMQRNFTYIDDIVAGLLNCLDVVDQASESQRASLKPVYNLGNNTSINLLDFITVLERILGIKAKIQLLPLQPGDVVDTVADITDTTNDFKFYPKVDVTEGMTNFVMWYRDYHSNLT